MCGSGYISCGMAVQYAVTCTLEFPFLLSCHGHDYLIQLELGSLFDRHCLLHGRLATGWR